MEPNIQQKGLVNWVLLLVLGSASAVVAQYANSAAGMAASVFMGLGFLVSAVSYVQMRLEERERLERMELDELKKTASSATLFTAEADDTFPARRAREQFERYFVRGFAVLLFLLQCTAAYLLWKYLGDDKPSTPREATVTMALNGLFALVFFQFGKYSAVLSRLQQERLLRPQASYMLLGAVLSLVVALVEVAGWAGYPKVDLIVARILTVVLGLVAAETLLTLVFEMYRPRLKGQAEHPLYESRLIGLLSQPGGLITTAAQALDYQFGFKVSETSFYRFLEDHLASLVLLQLAVLFLSSMLVFIEPGEQGLLERFGKPVESPVLGPGPHLKLPWPLSQVYRYETDAIQTFTVGLVTEEKDEEARVMLWAKVHAKEEFNMLVASRSQEAINSLSGDQGVLVNLLTVNMPVQYQVSDVQAFAYNHIDAGALLEKVANSEVTRYLVSVDLDEIMGGGRQAAAHDLQERIQARADALKLGVRIVFVGLYAIHPPVKVAPDFESVVGAIQDKEATNHYAHAYAAQRVPMARAEAALRVDAARIYQLRRASDSVASAGRFTNQVAAYNAAPEVYRWRSYLDSMGRSLATARKYVVTPTNTHQVYVLDLVEKIRPDLTDVMLPAKKP